MRFFKAYFLKGGVFEGRAGYIHAKLQGMYKFATLAKLYEAQHITEQDADLNAFTTQETQVKTNE